MQAIVPMPASASSRRYRVTPAPNPPSRSSTLASPNPGQRRRELDRERDGRTGGLERDAFGGRRADPPMRPRVGHREAPPGRGGGRQQLRTRQVGLEVQVGSGRVDRDATAVVPRRRFVVGHPATGERDLLRLHADGSERRVAVPRALSPRLRNARPSAYATSVLPASSVAAPPGSGRARRPCRRDGLEAGRPSYLAELHGRAP